MSKLVLRENEVILDNVLSIPIDMPDYNPVFADHFTSVLDNDKLHVILGNSLLTVDGKDSYNIQDLSNIVEDIARDDPWKHKYVKTHLAQRMKGLNLKLTDTERDEITELLNHNKLEEAKKIVGPFSTNEKAKEYLIDGLECSNTWIRRLRDLHEMDFHDGAIYTIRSPSEILKIKGDLVEKLYLKDQIPDVHITGIAVTDDCTYVSFSSNDPDFVRKNLAIVIDGKIKETFHLVPVDKSGNHNHHKDSLDHIYNLVKHNNKVYAVLGMTNLVPLENGRPIVEDTFVSEDRSNFKVTNDDVYCLSGIPHTGEIISMNSGKRQMLAGISSPVTYKNKMLLRNWENKFFLIESGEITGKGWLKHIHPNHKFTLLGFSDNYVYGVHGPPEQVSQRILEVYKI